MKFLYLLAIGLLTFNTQITAQTIDSDKSSIKFELSNMGVNTVEGSFKGMQGDIEFSAKNLEDSHFEVCIKASTVDTGIEKRDEHLKNEDYFYVEKYPKICFKSSSITKDDSDFKVVGELTMHGVSREVTIPFTYEKNTFSGNFELERLDYEIGSSGGFTVGHTVDVTIECVVK